MFLKQTFWEENNMKEYVVYGTYTTTKELGRVKADSEEEAIDKVFESMGSNEIQLCFHCSEKFLDHPILDEDTVRAKET